MSFQMCPWLQRRPHARTALHTYVPYEICVLHALIYNVCIYSHEKNSMEYWSRIKKTASSMGCTYFLTWLLH